MVHSDTIATYSEWWRVVKGSGKRQQTNRISCDSVPRAFTLLELLMVVAVVALIVVVATPAVMRTRKSAHRSACLNNIHQSALAVSMYMEDYDNVYPTYRVDRRYAANSASQLEWHDSFCRALDPQPNRVSWVTLTRPYAARSRALRPAAGDSLEVHPPDVYHCPDDENRGLAATSYEFKMLLATGLPLSQIHSLTATTLLWEQWAFHSEENWSEYDRRAEMNLVFVDGHAAWVRLANTTNARYGKGPNLHWLPDGASVPAPYREEDVVF